MAGTVKLPFVGTVKTGYAVAGAGVVAVIVGYAYIRHRNSAAAASSSSASPDTSAADTAASQSAIDPETGYPEGSPEDEAALQALESDSLGGGYSDYGLGYSDGYGYDYSGIPGTTTTANSNSGPGTFTDNSYWLAYAEENITGYTTAQIQGALTAYLAGQKLTETQYTIYQTALAVAGNPPSPPATAPVPPSSGSGGGTGGGGTGGTGTGSKTIAGTVNGLAVKSSAATSVTLDWSPEAGATGYKVSVLDRGTTHVKESETVKGTSATVSGLAKNARYEFWVQALPGASHSVTYASTT